MLSAPPPSALAERSGRKSSREKKEERLGARSRGALQRQRTPRLSEPAVVALVATELHSGKELCTYVPSYVNHTVCIKACESPKSVDEGYESWRNGQAP